MFSKKEEYTYPINPGLERFIKAQENDYEQALKEVREGMKRTHWIWYIFPQIQGLGHSCYATFYGIKDFDEAMTYLAHKVLGTRLRTITQVLLEHTNKTAPEIFGGLDAMKVKSCMTLFDAVSPNDIFSKVLEKYYDGVRCEKTLEYISSK